MLNWYAFSIISFLFFGIQNFIYKVAVEKKSDAVLTTFSFMITVAALSLCLSLLLQKTIANLPYLVILSFLNGVFLLVTTISRFQSLKFIDASLVYPLIKLSTLIVFTFSILYFKDLLSLFQVGGVCLALTALFLLGSEHYDAEKANGRSFKNSFWLIIAILASAITSIVTKFAAISVDSLNYITVSYIYNIIILYTMEKKLRERPDKINIKISVLMGILIGFFNFVAFYCALSALRTGPLAIISPLLGLSFVVSVILSIIIYQEKITTRKVSGFIFSILAILLLSL